MALRRASLGVVLAAALPVPVLGCVSRSNDKATKEKLSAYILDAAPEKLSARLGTDFGGKVELVGASIEPRGAVKPGAEVTVTLYWKSKQKLDSGWQLFTHVLDPAGERILNLDNVGALREVRDGKQALPPSSWDQGKVYADRQTFRVPVGVSGNRLTVVTGIWRGNERLAVTSGKHDSQNRATVATLSIAGASRAKPKEAPVPEVRVDKLAGDVKITVDGKLDEEAWKKAALIGPFVDVRTGEPNKAFPVNGSARLTYDATTLYVGFEVTDKDIVGGFSKNEKDPHLWTKDTVEIMIDPDGEGDNRDYYEIQVNPQNLVFDSQFDRYNEPKTEPNGPFGHQEWSSNLKSAVKIHGTLDDSKEDQGYTVEIAIPWASFAKAKKAPPALGDSWRMNFYAMQNNGGVAWSPILGKGNFHRATRFGRVIWAEPGFSPAPPPATEAAPAAPSASVGMRRIPARELLERGRAERDKVMVPQRQRSTAEGEVQ